MSENLGRFTPLIWLDSYWGYPRELSGTCVWQRGSVPCLTLGTPSTKLILLHYKFIKYLSFSTLHLTSFHPILIFFAGCDHRCHIGGQQDWGRCIWFERWREGCRHPRCPLRRWTSLCLGRWRVPAQWDGQSYPWKWRGKGWSSFVHAKEQSSPGGGSRGWRVNSVDLALYNVALQSWKW